MLSTDLSTALALFLGLVCVFAAFCVWYVTKLGQFCRASVKWVQNNNAKSLSLRQISELESAMTELLDSHQSLLDSHKKLRSRIGMRELRERRASELEPTDLQSADKRAVRLAAKSAGLLK